MLINKWGIMAIIVFIGVYSTAFQCEQKRIKGIVLSLVSTISFSIIASFLYDKMTPFLFFLFDSASSISITNDDIDMSNDVEIDSDNSIKSEGNA